MSIPIKAICLSILTTLLTSLAIYGIGFLFTYNSFTFSWCLNFFLMIWYTFLVSQLHPSLKSSYFNHKPFENKGKIYRYFGVHLFRKLLVWVGWEKISKKNNPIKNDISSLATCERNTRISELGHSLIALIVFVMMILLSHSLADAKWFLMTNLLLNIYPVMVQRYNRPRYQYLIKRKTS